MPSPVSGVVTKLHANVGETVQTRAPLVDFEGAEPLNTGETHEIAPKASTRSPAAGQGMVVGHMAASDEEFVDRAVIGSARSTQKQGRVRAAPTVRMLAKRLNVNLAACRATGRHGLVTIDDVLALANLSTRARSMPPIPGLTDADRLRGMRKAMSQSMSLSRDEIAMCTIFDDADIEAWQKGQDITARLIRAIVAGIEAEPGLNALFDPAGPARKLMSEVHLAIAVDTGEGLIVPVLRDVGSKSPAQLREALEDLKTRTRERTLSPEEMRDYTFTLSNFGMMAGRYATPLVVPPTVAILGSGRLQRDVVAGETGPEIHTRIPLSLTFDHRCITGGEACRFLAAVIADLNRSK